MYATQVISLTLLSVLAVANAQVVQYGTCPKVYVKEHFDISKYLGTWYGIQKLPTIFQKGQCSTATYSMESPGVVGVVHRELLADGTNNDIVGSAKAKDQSVPAKLELSFSKNSPPSPYWVLSTDYTGYSLVYSCTQYTYFRSELAWILSREPTMPAQTLSALRGILANAGIKVNKLVSTSQDPALCSSKKRLHDTAGSDGLPECNSKGASLGMPCH